MNTNGLNESVDNQSKSEIKERSAEIQDNNVLPDKEPIDIGSNSSQNENTAYCSQCGAPIECDAVFCNQCGAKISEEPNQMTTESGTDCITKTEIVLYCNQCGAPIDADSAFCNQCGSKTDWMKTDWMKNDSVERENKSNIFKDEDQNSLIMGHRIEKKSYCRQCGNELVNSDSQLCDKCEKAFSSRLVLH